MMTMHDDHDHAALDQRLRRDAQRLMQDASEDAAERIMEGIPHRDLVRRPGQRRSGAAWAILGSAAAAIIAIGPAGALAPDDSRPSPAPSIADGAKPPRGPLVVEAERLAATARAGWARFRETLPRPPRFKG